MSPEEFYRRHPGMAPTYGALVRKFRWVLLLAAVTWALTFIVVALVSRGASP